MVKEITEWDKAQTEKGAKTVCAARQRHVAAYNALQANYKNFVKAFSEDRRLNLPGSVESFKTLVKACIDHKFGLTTGGHNIMIDVIENDIAASCLTLGRQSAQGRDGEIQRAALSAERRRFTRSADLTFVRAQFLM